MKDQTQLNCNMIPYKLLANEHHPGHHFQCFRDGNSIPVAKSSKTWSHRRFTFCSLLANVQYIKYLFLGSSNKMTFSGLIFFFPHFWFVQGKLQTTAIWFPKGIHKNLTFWNCYFFGMFTLYFKYVLAVVCWTMSGLNNPSFYSV